MKRMTFVLFMAMVTEVAVAQAQVGPMTTCVTEEVRDRGFLRIPQRREVTRCTTTSITGMPGFGGVVGSGGYVGAGLVGMPISPAYVASDAVFRQSEQYDAWLAQRLYGQVPAQQAPAPAMTTSRTQASPRPTSVTPVQPAIPAKTAEELAAEEEARRRRAAEVLRLNTRGVR